MTPPLRRTRGDIIATCIIVLVCVLALGLAWYKAPIRGSHLSPATAEFHAAAAPTRVPDSLPELWHRDDAQPAPAQQTVAPRPVVVGGVVILPSEHGVRGLDPRSGQQLWSYEREETLCGLGTAWQKVTAVFDAGFGCGDVVQIKPHDGTYGATRSAIAEDPVGIVQSNDRVGIIGAERVELWRDDAVRTIEYGDNPARQEPNMQPHVECSPAAALTRKDDLVLLDRCPDHSSWVRIMDTSPEDSRKPEVKHEFALSGDTSTLVALGASALAVYEDGALVSYDFSGAELSRTPIAPPAEGALDAPYRPAIADLPHHMSWYDGHSWHLFEPTDLRPTIHKDDALGTGVSLNGQLLYPVRGGVAVADSDTGEVRRTIPVDRGSWQGPVSLSLAGDVLVEQRGASVVALSLTGK
ncbi:PQQ-binding-like beta-propeller repeat protein [Corynebacterium uropygiale]|uniref:PQQ-binding-like beta-propeller repeat protein n=1 Tax=Corynebacterium uropygiale TaxID=1775911 RepID=A0A9X1QQU7_9CORY|nr:PQQ-binding-like beta-propeller repeat protein [Corynebacterium uropygiale]MCF4006088.1 PQQ-binding-like beta-propeller repeat protein [Corynebacterium uropygiale]